MAQQIITTGNSASDGNGESLRSAFTKINENFTELYSGNVQVTAANVLVYSVNGQIGNVSLTVADIPNAASKGYVTNAVAGNIAILNSSFNSVNANVAAANAQISTHTGQISTLQSNAASQAVTLANLVSSKAYISYVDSSISNALSSNAILANVATVNANVAAANAAIATKASLSGATFTGNVTTNQYIFAQGAVIGNQTIDYPNSIFSIADNISGPFGLVVQNTSTAANAVGVITVLADDGSALENFVAIGVNNSNYNDPTYPDAEPHEAFIFAEGGNLRVISNTGGIVFAAGTSRMYMDPIYDRLELFNVNIQFSDGTIQSTAFGGNANISGLNANIIAANANITILQSNVTSLGLDVAALYSNAGTQATNINTLLSNAATQAVTLNSVSAALTLSNANAVSQSVEINSLRANLIAANANIAILQSNVTSINLDIAALYSNGGAQATSLSSLISNAATQATTLSLLASNAASQESSLTALVSNSATQSIQLNAINANVSAANANILILQGNVTSINLDISAIYSNLGSYVSNITQTNANVTAANARIAAIDANLGTATTNITTLSSNAAVQAISINLLNANVAAANAAISNVASLSGAIFNGNVRAGNVIANSNVFVGSTLRVGGNVEIDFPDVAATFTGNVDSYYQLVLRNINSGSNASGDIVITADDGDDSSNYLNIGMNSSNFTGNFIGTFGDTNLQEFPHDGYITVIGGNAALRSDGNVFLAANTRVIRFIQDGNFELFNTNLQFADSTVQTTAIVDVPGLYANIGAISDTVANLVSTSSVQSANISTLISNAAIQATFINDINANLGGVLNSLSTLTSNASSQSTAIDLLNANVVAANLATSTLQANLGSYQTFANANAASQAAALNVIDSYRTWANSGGFIANITSNNGSVNFGTNVVLSAQTSIATDQLFTIRPGSSGNGFTLSSNGNVIIDATSWIELRTGFGTTLPSFNVSNWDANIGALRTDTNTLLSNAGSQATAINSINANVGAYQTYANANVVAILANLGSFQTFANANAAVQSVLIDLINANVTAANAAIAAIDFSALTATNANVAAANVEILAVQANVTAANIQHAANVVAANIEIAALRANITASNLLLPNLRAISSNVVPNANITFDLGNTNYRWGNVWANTSLRLGLSTITTSGGNIYVDGNPVGAGTYGNTQVAQYLVNYTGNITANFANIASNIIVGNLNATRVITANVSYTMGNVTHWTSTVSNVAAALDQLAARIYAIENP